MLPYIFFAAFASCFLLEHARPGWRLPAVRGWWWRVLAVSGAQLAIVVVAGFTWDAGPRALRCCTCRITSARPPAA